MSSGKIKEYIEVIVSIIGLVSTLGLGIYESNKIFIIICAVIFIIIMYNLFKTLSKRKKEKILSNSGLAKEANITCSKIMKLLKSNTKYYNKISKRQNKNDLKYLMEKIKFKTPISLEELISRRQKISDIILSSILDLDRILLISEQYSYRLRFGRFLVEYASDPEIKQKAYIDFLGWTYVILGKNKKAEEAIFNGIKIIDEQILLTDDEKVKNKYLMQKARAYRHLGSNHNLYTKYPDNSMIYLNEGLNILENEKFREYFLSDDKLKRKYEEMMVGMKYGIAISLLYKYKNNDKKINHGNLENYLKQSKEIIDEYKNLAKEFDNKHRYIKYLLLENNILKEYNKKYELEHKGIEYKVNHEEFISKSDDNLIAVKKQLDLSIYCDEAMLFYLEQKLDLLKTRINDLLEVQ